MWIIAVFLLPIVFAVAAVYVILQLTGLLLRIVFAPLVWLTNRPPKARIELRHYERKGPA